MKKKKDYKRIIALVLAVCVLTGAAATVLAVGFPPVQQAMANTAASQADRQTAQELSDMTGIAPYRLLEMKQDKGDWNRVLQAVQQGNEMPEADLSEEELAQRCAEYAPEEVEAAETLVSRVVFALREITARQQTESAAQPAAPTLAPAGEEVAEERNFAALEGEFQKNRAIWLVLETAQAKGTQQSALDEYLYSLQIGIDYELFLTDAEDYEKQAAQQGAALTRESAITVMEIEQKLIELLSGADDPQQNNADVNQASSPEPEIAGDAPQVQQQPGLELPETPAAAPGQDSVQRPSAPQPGAEVYEEIERINRDSRRSPAQIGGSRP